MSEFQATQRKWSHLQVAKLLISHTALTELSLEDAQKIVQRMHTRSMKEGSVLVQEGTSSNNNYMLLILSGEAVVENEGLKKKDAIVLGVVSTGHIIGEMGLLDGEARSATCKAFTDMEVAVLDGQAVSELISKDPATGCKLLAALLQRTSSRLRTANQKLRVLTQINRSLEQEITFMGGGKAPEQPKVAGNPDNPLIF